MIDAVTFPFFFSESMNQLLNLTALLSMLAVPALSAVQDILIADFEKETYAPTVTGEAFGPGSARGTLPGQVTVSCPIGSVRNEYTGDYLSPPHCTRPAPAWLRRDDTAASPSRRGPAQVISSPRPALRSHRSI